MSLGARRGQLVTHISHGEIRAGAKLLPSGFFCTCVCVRLSVCAGAECWVSKARGAPVLPLATGTAGFWFPEQSWTKGTALGRGLCSPGARGVSRAFIVPLSWLLPLLLGSLSFFCLFYFKVAFCNKRTKETKKMPLGGLGGGEVSLLCRCRCGCPCARLVDSCRHAIQGLLCLVFVCSLCLFGLVCILRAFFAFKEKKSENCSSLGGHKGLWETPRVPGVRGKLSLAPRADVVGACLASLLSVMGFKCPQQGEQPWPDEAVDLCLPEQDFGSACLGVQALA